jgi:hypothetical protein
VAVTTSIPASAALRARLVTWTGTEESPGAFATVAGQHPNVVNYYLAWGQPFPGRQAE